MIFDESRVSRRKQHGAKDDQRIALFNQHPGGDANAIPQLQQAQFHAALKRYPNLRFFSMPRGLKGGFSGSDAVRLSQTCRCLEAVDISQAKEFTLQHLVVMIAFLPILRVIWIDGTEAAEELRRIPHGLWPQIVHPANPSLTIECFSPTR